MVVNWRHTGLNLEGGVSSFRFLVEEKEQLTLLSVWSGGSAFFFPPCLSLPPATAPSQMRLVLLAACEA